MPMPLSQSPMNSQKPTQQVAMRHLQRWRQLTLLMVAGLALLAASVAIGQASQNYDLACRGILTATGGTTMSSNLAVTGALGNSIVPPKESDTNPTYAVRSADYAVRGGFLPAYPNAQGAEVALAASKSEHFMSEAGVSQRFPFIRKMTHIVRGGC